MANINETLELLRFELKFLEDGGYGRFPRAPWRPSFIFEDSPTCLNFGDPSRTIPCEECVLMQFVPEELKAERRARLMELSAEISAARLAQKVGRRLQVLVDRVEGDIAVARSSSDAPEIDGTVRIHKAKGVQVGSLAEVRITAAGAYDLEATLIQ